MKKLTLLLVRFASLAIAKRPFVFLLLAIVVLGPLLLPGGLFALDSPIALNRDTTGYLWNTSDGPSSVFAATYTSAPITMALRLLPFVPFAFAEKLWLIFVLWLCGYGASRLPGVTGYGRFVAGVFYTINPFTYYRFVAGQWGVLAAYALIPWVVTEFVEMADRPSLRKGVTLALLLTAVSVVQVHGIFLALLALAVLTTVLAVTQWAALRQALPALLVSAGLFIGLNLFWLVRYAGAGNSAVNHIDVAELTYFAAKPPLQALSLFGFWLPGPYVDPRDYLPFGVLFFAPLLFMAVYGLVTLSEDRSRRWVSIGLATLGAVAAFLAIGPGLQATQSLFTFLWEHVSLYRVFRDSHKFIGLLALVYAYGLGVGIVVLTDRLRLRSARLAMAAAVGVILLTVAYAFPMLGSWGQIKPADYPADWKEARALLDSDHADFNVLVFPWHMYMDFQWLPDRWKRLVNPAPNFFSQPTVSGDNLEVGPVGSNSSNPVSHYVEALLAQKETHSDFGARLVPLNVRYVVLFKEVDYLDYDFLDRQEDMQLVYDGPNISVYRNNVPTARAYIATTILPVDSVSEYLQRSDSDPTVSVYPLTRDGKSMLSIDPGVAGTRPAPATASRRNPVDYSVAHSEGALVFTLPQHVRRDGWTYEGKDGAANLGMNPAFPVSAGQGHVRLASFYTRDLPLYGLALGTLVAMAWIWRRTPRNAVVVVVPSEEPGSPAASDQGTNSTADSGQPG